MATPEVQSASPPRKLRWFQFSLRTLLILVLLASIGMSFLAVRMQRAKRQSEAVEAIRRAGGGVGYDFEIDPASQWHAEWVPNPQPPGPKWLRRLLGADFFADVVFAQITNDEGMQHLKELPRLRWVSGGSPRTQITDVGLEGLQGLTELQALYLDHSAVTDAGMERLEGLTSLEVLGLRDTNVSDAGLEHLKGLVGLRQLLLSRTRITDAGLEHIRGLTQLRAIMLGRTGVTRAGEKSLQQALPNCEIVGI